MKPSEHAASMDYAAILKNHPAPTCRYMLDLAVEFCGDHDQRLARLIRYMARHMDLDS